MSICDSAAAARARNSPDAAQLETQCRSLGGNPNTVSSSLDDLALKGAEIALQDPLSAELRKRQPQGPYLRGFDIGMGASEGQTSWGPGKQAILNSLSGVEQEGFKIAISFVLDRNRFVDLARVGATIAETDPELAKARTSQADVRYWLGFDIATGIFGDPTQGAKGNTLPGPGSDKIQSSLSLPAQQGFAASRALHLSRHY